VKVEKMNGYVMVSFYNYQGASRDFHQRGFLLTGNGFVAEVSGQKQSGSFDSFRKKMEAVHIEDTLYSGVHGRQTYLRRTKYSRSGLSLDCEYSPVSEGIKHAAVNGKVPEYPRLKATGLDVSGLFFDQ
jgi:hypothetical protein